MKEQFIEGVHNYCDRWCERCPFTARCVVYASEQEISEETKDPSDPAFWLYIKKNFEEVLESLNRMMAEMGIDPDDTDGIKAAEPNPDIQALEKKMRDKTLYYANAVNDFFQESAAYFERKGEELEEEVEKGRPVDLEQWQFFQDALEVIRWYQYFISAKVQRAVHNLEHLELFDDPVQSDANGSAKIAVIAIERSLGAWEMVRHHLPEKQNEILALQQHLQHLLSEMEHLFPQWQKFHRPGWDDEPQHALRLDFNPN